MPIRNISWDETVQAISGLTQKIKDSQQKAGKRFTGVYGIPRGGQVVAIMLSYALELPYLGAPTEFCIVADDVTSSGKTLECYRRAAVKVAIAKYKDCPYEPTFWEIEIETGQTIFPWERLWEPHIS